MLASGVIDVVRGVLATDPTTCDADELTPLAADVHRLRCWLDSIDAAVVARSAQLGHIRRSTLVSRGRRRR